MIVSDLSSVARTSSVVECAPLPPAALVPDMLVHALTKAPPVLTEMTLLDKYLELIRPSLTGMGFSVTNDHLDQIVGKETIEFRFTMVRNGVSRALVQLGNEVLTVVCRENRLALAEVRDLFLTQGEFRKEKRLYIFHDSNPHGAFKAWVQGEWFQNHGIRSKFVPLTDLAGFPDMQLAQQSDYLRLTLDLVGQPDGTPSKPAPKEMPAGHMKRLAEILAGLPRWTDEGVRGRRVMVAESGLLEFVNSYNFEGGPKTVAFDLIVDLLDEGLGLLLKLIQGQQDLRTSDKKFVGEILESYSF